MDREQVDVVVVGTGIAGVRTAKILLDQGNRVALVTKTQLASGSSFYPLKASLGTQVTNGQEDKADFIEDINAMSRGMHQSDLADIYVNEIEEAVKEYESIGIHATRLSGVRKACFSKHSRQIFLLQDWDKIRKNMQEMFASHPSLILHEKSSVFSLNKKDGRIIGVFMLNKENEIVYIETKAVILATGGFGNIYKHNLNPVDVDGSGHILALDAGASLVNMEFIQFIPGFTKPKYKTLFGEHTLNYCVDLLDDADRSLFKETSLNDEQLKELLSIRSTHGPFTHTLDSRLFDIIMMKHIIKSRNEDGLKIVFDQALYDNKEEFYTVYLQWLKERGIDLVKDMVMIAPFAHASNGGVKINGHGSTDVPGLYAVGELSSNVEGANRLGGNSTGASMIFGKRAANHCHDYVTHKSHVHQSDQELNHQIKQFLDLEVNGQPEKTLDDYTLHEIIAEIKDMLWYHANVVRNERDLLHVLKRLSELKGVLNPVVFLEEPSVRKTYLKASNYIQLGEILVRSMLMRKESRGAHYREDYPDENENYAYPIVARKQLGTVVFTFNKE